METVGNRKRILLVDDDEAVRQSLKLLLDVDEHYVTEAANGRQALSLFGTSKYDLIITDYLMPEMLGDELARSIRTVAPSQPILMITAYVERLAGTGTPRADILAKPISVEDLRQAILGQTERVEPAQDASAVGLSRSALLHRAGTKTCLLDDMLRSQEQHCTRSRPGTLVRIRLEGLNEF